MIATHKIAARPAQNWQMRIPEQTDHVGICAVEVIGWTQQKMLHHELSGRVCRQRQAVSALTRKSTLHFECAAESPPASREPLDGSRSRRFFAIKRMERNS